MIESIPIVSKSLLFKIINCNILHSFLKDPCFRKKKIVSKDTFFFDINFKKIHFFYIFDTLINENCIFQKIQLCLIKSHWLKIIGNN